MNLAHTFCDFTNLTSQAAADEFGSKSTTLFQCASSFSGSAGLAANAVVDGLCAIQPVAGNATLVNIILKPTAEVFEDVPVAYFILRGIAKSDFFTTNGSADILFTTAPVGNQWLKRITDNQAAYNVEMQAGYDANKKPSDPPYTPATITPAALGWAPDSGAWAATDPLETIFTGCTLQKVQAGWQLGTFANDANLEVVLHTDAWQPDLIFARQAVGTIEMPTATGRNSFGNSQVEDYEFKQRRERVLGFLDPCTFYALVAANGQISNRPVGTTSPTAYTGSAARLNVLAKFNDPAKIYLDLRNHLGQSLNFYNDYLVGSNFMAQVQVAGPGGPAVTYAYHSGHGWPLLVLRTTERAALNLAGGSDATLQLALPTQTGGLPMVFVVTKHLYRAAKLQRQEFIEPVGGIGAFAGPIPLRIPAGLGTYLKLSYFIRYDVTQFANTPFNPAKLVKQDTLDNLLNISPVPLNRPPSYLVSTSSAEIQYIGCTSRTTGTDYLIRNGEAQDDLGNYYYAYMVQPSESFGVADLTKIRVPLNLRQLRVKNANFIYYLSDRLNLFRIFNSTISDNSVYNCLELHSYSHNYLVDPLLPSADSLMVVALASSEAQQVRALCTTSFVSQSKTYFVAVSHVLASDTDGIAYFKLMLGIQGPSYTATSSSMRIVSTNIEVFSRDGKNYFSSLFAGNFIAQLPAPVLPVLPPVADLTT